jgi:glutathione peroxidase
VSESAAFLAVAVFFLSILATASSFSLFPSGAPADNRKSIFEFNVRSNNGTEISLSSMKGKKAYLIVNVASQCGLTERNYDQLNQLYEKYASQGLEILAFPCNNFLYQEPGSDAEIKSFCQGKGVKFPVMAKVDCGNSAAAEPLFPFLCQKLPDDGLISTLIGTGPKWNFTKFLCDKNGIPIKRFQPNVNPLDFEDDIISLLADSITGIAGTAGETSPDL